MKMDFYYLVVLDDQVNYYPVYSHDETEKYAREEVVICIANHRYTNDSILDFIAAEQYRNVSKSRPQMIVSTRDPRTAKNGENFESGLSYDAKRRFCNLMSETDTSKIDDHQVYDFYLRIPFIPESASQVSSDILQLNTPCLNKRVQVTLAKIMG